MQYQFDGERERRAEFAMPKRTKQMGGIEQRLRIFVEDYVYTYLYQYGRSGGGAEKLAALVTTPAAEFDSTNEDVQFKLLGMYGDDSGAGRRHRAIWRRNMGIHRRAAAAIL